MINNIFILVIIVTCLIGCEKKIEESDFLKSFNLPVLTTKLLSPENTNKIESLASLPQGGASSFNMKQGIMKEWSYQTRIESSSFEQNHFLNQLREKIESEMAAKSLKITERRKRDDSFSIDYEDYNIRGDIYVCVVLGQNGLLHIIGLIHEN